MKEISTTTATAAEAEDARFDQRKLSSHTSPFFRSRTLAGSHARIRSASATYGLRMCAAKGARSAWSFRLFRHHLLVLVAARSPSEGGGGGFQRFFLGFFSSFSGLTVQCLSPGSTPRLLCALLPLAFSRFLAAPRVVLHTPVLSLHSLSHHPSPNLPSVVSLPALSCDSHPGLVDPQHTPHTHTHPTPSRRVIARLLALVPFVWSRSSFPLPCEYQVLSVVCLARARVAAESPLRRQEPACERHGQANEEGVPPARKGRPRSRRQRSAP